MRVLVIDDERLAREELKRLLQEHPAMRVVGEADNVGAARKAIDQLQPDLIFLDVQMPDGSGFDLLASLDRAPAVIFTTAYDQYALRAFDVSALDYLLKPVDPERLALSVLKANAQVKVEPDGRLAPDGKVFIKDGERCWFVALDEIVLLESEGNYTRVYFDQHNPLMLRSLNQMESKLDPQHFMRVSRRQIVNLRCVTGIAPGLAGGLTLTLNGDLKVSMSRRRAAQFRQLKRL
jgi:two-component system LytT family response regulator